MWANQGGWSNGGWARAAASSALLNYDFTGGSLPSGVSASGATNGTRINSSGVLVASTAPRFDYTIAGASLGILNEPAASNILFYSALGAAWDSSTGTHTFNNAVSPDGTTNASTLAGGTSNNTTRNMGTITSANHTASIWLRAPGGSASVHLSFSNGQASPQITTACSVTGTWQRFSVSGIVGGSSCFFQIGEWATNSWGPTASIEIWGPQIETGLVVTTYIPTPSNVAVTRSADAISFTIPVGITSLLYTFDDNSTQTVSVSSGAYNVPTSLNRLRIKAIVGS